MKKKKKKEVTPSSQGLSDIPDSVLLSGGFIQGGWEIVAGFSKSAPGT